MDYREVYSTGKGDLRKKKQNSQTPSALPPGIKNDGIIRLRKETKGRGGKVVTAVYGIPLPVSELSGFLKKLKQKCGTGGQLKDGVIFIQGDKTAELGNLIEKEGYMVKKAGS